LPNDDEDDDEDDEEGAVALAIVVLSFISCPFFAVVGAGVDDVGDVGDVGSSLASDMALEEIAGIYIVR
jgi:hypothetical protein